MSTLDDIVNAHLLSICAELCDQPNVGKSYDESELPYEDEMETLKEYVEVREYSVAYESIVATLEKHEFVLSGRRAVRLLELGLIMKFKTDREEDSIFDLR